MIQLTPVLECSIRCNNCDRDFAANDWFLTGIHSVATGKCTECGTSFIQELPSNAGLFYPGTLDASSGKRVDKLPFTNWYLNGFEDAYRSRTNEDVHLEVIEHRKLTRAKVAILNTIDHCYGHVLFELFNASWYLKQQDVDLIILVQKNFRWLLPEGAAQIWLVDIPFSHAGKWYDKLAAEAKRITSKCENVFLCRSFVQTDDSDYSIEDYSGVKPFPLEEWNKKLERPTVTFIWRSDRFWKPVLPKLIDNAKTRKIIGGMLNRARRKRQLNWLVRFAEKLRANIPNIDFAVAGMDPLCGEDRMPSWIKDIRFASHNDVAAVASCERYAQSHLVLGCNGSSLILPSCHAGAVINIVPMNQWAASAGSFAFRCTSFGDTQFRYQLLPGDVSITSVVDISTSILRDRLLVELHTCKPWRDHSAKLPQNAWAEFRIDAFQACNQFRDSSGLVTINR